MNLNLLDVTISNSQYGKSWAKTLPKGAKRGAFINPKNSFWREIALTAPFFAAFYLEQGSKSLKRSSFLAFEAFFAKVRLADHNVKSRESHTG